MLSLALPVVHTLLFAVASGLPTPAVEPGCPTVLLRIPPPGATTIERSAASFDTTGAYWRLRYDRPNANASVVINGSATSWIQVRDRYVLRGGAPGQEVPVIARARLSGDAGGGCSFNHGCAGAGASLVWSAAAAGGTLTGENATNREELQNLTIRVDEPFVVDWRLTVDAYHAGGYLPISSYQGSFRILNFPTGMWLESCAGFFDDVPVAAVPDLVSSSVTAETVELAWSSPGSEAAALAVERAEDGTDWAPIEWLSSSSHTIVRFVDRNIVPGRRYGYRLAWSDGSLERRTTSETWMTVPGVRLSMALSEPLTPGKLPLRLSLPSTEPVRFELYDVRGRRVLVEEWAPSRHGAVEVELDTGGRLAPGALWLRASQGTDRAVLRVILGPGR